MQILCPVWETRAWFSARHITRWHVSFLLDHGVAVEAVFEGTVFIHGRYDIGTAVAVDCVHKPISVNSKNSEIVHNQSGDNPVCDRRCPDMDGILFDTDSKDQVV